MRRAFWTILLMAAASVAQAGTQQGTVQDLRVRASDGLVYFVLSGSKNSSPACATRSYWMIRDENSNAGKQQYAMLLAAKLAGKSVIVLGLNTCARWADGEDANEIYVVD